MSEVQVVYLTVEEIYALERLIEDVDFEDEDAETNETFESLESASESLYRSRHYRHRYHASSFRRLSFEEGEALKKLHEQTN